MEGTMIKDIVVNLSADGNDDATVGYAVSLAREFNAHLTAVVFAYEAIPPGVMIDGAPSAWFDELQQEREQAATAAVAKFNEATRGSGVSTQAYWLSASVAGAADLFARIARRFDVSIIRQSEPDRTTPHPLIIEAALFETGRPVLIVPYIRRAGFELGRVMVCWDGSRSAARAVGDAMPFLVRAKAVEVVIVGGGVKSDEIAGADIAQHLARHGAKVELKQIVAPDIDAANALLSHAADVSADLIVMGGYGHSRLREFVLGGVTRSILATMTVPALMSH
jgi:nucleotide-binding universal stress UspA family protein